MENYDSAYATVWVICFGAKGDSRAKSRISISRTNKRDKYESDFNGRVTLACESTETGAFLLKLRDGFRLFRVDTITTYDMEKNTKYRNCRIIVLKVQLAQSEQRRRCAGVDRRQ